MSSSHPHYLVLSHWILSDTKSPQISKTLLSILNIAVVIIISIISPISNSYSRLFRSLWMVLRAPLTTDIISHLFQSFLYSLTRSKYISFLTRSLIFSLWSTGTAKSTLRQVFFFIFFINDYYVWSSDRKSLICLNLKFLENFMHLVLPDRFWFVHELLII